MFSYIRIVYLIMILFKLSSLFLNVKGCNHHVRNINHFHQTALLKRSLNDNDSIVFDSKYNESDMIKINDTIVYKGYRNMISRLIQLPNGKHGTYDIVAQKHASVIVFIWDSISCTTTLIREYHPGVEQWKYGTVAGMYEDKKHQNPLQAAMYELEEEAQLASSHWIPLLNDMNATVSFDKYSNNQFFPYLAIDCYPVINPRAMDAEEFITVHHGISYEQLIKMIASGEINILSTYSILLGINKLKELGYKIENN